MEVVKDLMLKGHEVRNSAACPRERTRPFRWHRGGSVKSKGRREAWKAAGKGSPNSSGGGSGD